LAELLAQRAGQFAQVDLGPQLLDDGPALRRTFDHALTLLQPGGVLVLQASGLSPAQARERLAAQTGAFWLSGWFSHRLGISAVLGLDAQGLPSREALPQEVRIVLRKVETSLAERTLARVAREDYALDDLLDAPAVA
jgi:hypothetical protein